MNVKTLWIVAMTISVLAIVALALALGSSAAAQSDITALEKRRTDSLTVAMQLRQTSNDLTRMARNFAVTADPRYEDLYRRVVAVRDGKQPRPARNASAHWDLLLGGVEPPKGNGERVGLAEALQRLELPETAQALVRRAQAAQDKLEKLEASAFAAMRGQSPGGDSASPGVPNPVQALTTLYSAEYLEAKAQSEQALDALYTEIELTTRGALTKAHQAQARDLQVGWVVLFGFAVAGGSALLLIFLRGLRPLHELRRHAQAIKKGDYAQRTDMRALGEVGELMKGLNEASSRLEVGARELEERDRYLEALLRTSPLGLVLVDTRNRIRWTSRRLREFLGDSKQDLKQMPFDEFFADPAELAVFRDVLERKGRVRELIARIRRRDGSEFRARLDSSYVERSAERLAAVWVQAFGLHAQRTDASAAGEPAPTRGS